MGINVRSTALPQEQQESLMTRARQVDLAQFIQTLNIDLRNHSGSVSSSFCPHCGESSNHSTKLSINDHLWKCWSCGRAGSIVDYGAFYWDVLPVEAAKRIADMAGKSIIGSALSSASEFVRSKASAFINHKPKVAKDYSAFFKKMHYEGHTFNKDAFEYMTKVRGLSERVITEAVNRGVIRFLPSNPHEAHKWLLTKFQEAQLRSLGLWKEGSRMPWIAMRPMIFFLPGLTSAEFRIIKEPKENDVKSIRVGSSENAYTWRGDNHKSLAVVEGVIDMLSLVDMKWKADIKALPGAQTFKDEWVDQSYKDVFVFTDNDSAGKDVAPKISKAAQDNGSKVIVRHPPAGDINKELLAQKKLKQSN
jgi:hypothetical protein